MTDHEWKLVQEVAASAARSCDIVVAADKLAEELERELRCYPPDADGMYIYGARIRAALDAFKVVRQGT